MNKFKTVAVAAMASVVLMGTAACEGQQAEVNAGEVKSGTNAEAPSATPTAEATPSEAPVEEAPEDNGILAFGEQAVFEDGLAVTVSKPKPFTPGQWSAGGEKFDNHVIFTVTIVNDTNLPYDPVLYYESVQSGNVEGDSVFDSDNGLEGSPMTTVLPGREAEFTVGYGVKDPSDIVMEVTVDYEHDAVIYVTE